jgi:hypothetical protein
MVDIQRWSPSQYVTLAVITVYVKRLTLSTASGKSRRHVTVTVRKCHRRSCGEVSKGLTALLQLITINVNTSKMTVTLGTILFTVTILPLASRI